VSTPNPTALSSLPASILEEPQRLPRGPHGLSRDEVAASQRARLQRALTKLLAEGGWAEVKIGPLCSRAGVSRGTFYAHFKSREECLLSAYRDWAGTLVSAITVEVPAEAGWTAFVTTTLDAYLGALAADPAATRAFVVEMDAAGPEARAARRDSLNLFSTVFAARHAEIRTVDPGLAPIPDRVYLAIAFAVRELIRDELESREPDELPGLRDDLVFFATAIVQGAGLVPAQR